LEPGGKGGRWQKKRRAGRKGKGVCVLGPKESNHAKRWDLGGAARKQARVQTGWPEHSP